MKHQREWTEIVRFGRGTILTVGPPPERVFWRYVLYLTSGAAAGLLLGLAMAQALPLLWHVARSTIAIVASRAAG